MATCKAYDWDFFFFELIIPIEAQGQRSSHVPLIFKFWVPQSHIHCMMIIMYLNNLYNPHFIQDCNPMTYTCLLASLARKVYHGVRT